MIQVTAFAFTAYPLLLKHTLYAEPKREGSIIETLAKGDFSGVVDDVVRFTETPEGKKVMADFNKAFPRPEAEAKMFLESLAPIEESMRSLDFGEIERRLAKEQQLRMADRKRLYGGGDIS